jgi:manganese/zinc/iron transport system ATP- binding protein
LARALAQEADLYLMDEPFVGVDATTEQAIIQLLQGMKKEGKTLIVVHHDLQSAAQYFDWLVLLNLRLIASAPTEQALTPALLRETYGGRLTLLSEVGDLLKKSEFPSREQP